MYTHKLLLLLIIIINDTNTNDNMYIYIYIYIYRRWEIQKKNKENIVNKNEYDLYRILYKRNILFIFDMIYRRGLSDAMGKAPKAAAKSISISLSLYICVCIYIYIYSMHYIYTCIIYIYICISLSLSLSISLSLYIYIYIYIYISEGCREEEVPAVGAPRRRRFEEEGPE